MASVGILLDLDETLIWTAAIEDLRARQQWAEVERQYARTRLPPDTRWFIDTARKYGEVGVVTTAPRPYAEKLLRYHNLADVRVLVANREAGRRKPFPDPILEAANKLGFEPGQCLYIGDLPDDMQAARDAGAVPVGMVWPHQAGSTRLGAEQPRCRDWGEVLRHVMDLHRATRFEPNDMRMRPYGEDSGLTDSPVDTLAAFGYAPVRSGLGNAVTHLVLAFKEGKAAGGELNAVERVTSAVIKTVRRNEVALRDERQCRYVVCAPSHTATPGPNAAAWEQVATALAREFSWITHLPRALRRATDVRKSTGLSYEERASVARVQEHINSLVYAGPMLNASRTGILLLDDVVTFGATLLACRAILQDATRCRNVVGLFVGRTIQRPWEVPANVPD